MASICVSLHRIPFFGAPLFPYFFGPISLLLSDGSLHGIWNTLIISHLAALIFYYAGIFFAWHITLL